MAVDGIRTIGFIGAGHIGAQLARLAVREGYDAVVSNSRGPETLGDLVAELGEHARAGTTEEAAEAGDLVVVSIPLRSIDTVPVVPLAGKIVIDTNNYYDVRDGSIARLDAFEATTAGLLQEHLPTSKVVKAFNHILWSSLTTKGTPSGTPGRRALVVYGDDPAARRTVEALIDEFGFDAVDAGPLEDSWRVERDQPAYSNPADKAGATELLTKAVREIQH